MCLKWCIKRKERKVTSVYYCIGRCSEKLQPSVHFKWLKQNEPCCAAIYFHLADKTKHRYYISAFPPSCLPFHSRKIVDVLTTQNPKLFRSMWSTHNGPGPLTDSTPVQSAGSKGWEKGKMYASKHFFNKTSHLWYTVTGQLLYSKLAGQRL